MKSARIVQYLASDAVWWQENKYALQQQNPLLFLKSVWFVSLLFHHNIMIIGIRFAKAV